MVLSPMLISASYGIMGDEMMFIVPDEKGQIIQANKVFEPEGYGDLLDSHGVKYVTSNGPALLPPELWYVPDGVLTERPVMDISVSKTTVKAGGTDSSVILGIPKQAEFDVIVTGQSVWNGTIPDGEFEISVPTPGIYEVVFNLWPYQTFRTQIEAVA